MKKKTVAPKKKAAPKKKPAKGKVKLVTVHVPGVRVISASQQEGSFHLVRIVMDCSAINRKFSTIESLNEFLFEFDMENFGTDPAVTGNWIDSITTNIQGDFFDFEDLESEK